MKNTNDLPHLKVILNSQKHKNYRQIMDGENPLHYIENVREFYYAVGYTDDMAKAMIMPDEFVWDEYVNNSRYSICLQKHTLDYLNDHSPLFYGKYGEAYEQFKKTHDHARLERGDHCAGCKLHKLCSDAVN